MLAIGDKSKAENENLYCFLYLHHLQYLIHEHHPLLFLVRFSSDYDSSAFCFSFYYSLNNHSKMKCNLVYLSGKEYKLELDSCIFKKEQLFKTKRMIIMKGIVDTVTLTVKMQIIY